MWTEKCPINFILYLWAKSSKAGRVLPLLMLVASRPEVPSASLGCRYLQITFLIWLIPLSLCLGICRTHPASVVQFPLNANYWRTTSVLPVCGALTRNGKFIGKINRFLLVLVARINIRHGEWKWLRSYWGLNSAVDAAHTHGVAWRCCLGRELEGAGFSEMLC